MKKYVSIFMLSVFLLSTTEVYQFLKLPKLIEHYKEHKLLDNKITFLDFLYMHYANGHVYDADYDKDMKLPFKTCDNCGMTCPIVLQIKEILIISFPQKIIASLSKQTISKRTFDILSTYLSTIWQPPKFNKLFC